MWKEEARQAALAKEKAALAKERAAIASKEEAVRLELQETLAREEKAQAAAQAQRFEVSFPGIDSIL